MKFHCSICAKNVYDKDKAVLYDLCQLWVYVACNTFNYLDYRYLKSAMNIGTA